MKVFQSRYAREGQAAKIRTKKFDLPRQRRTLENKGKIRKFNPKKSEMISNKKKVFRTKINYKLYENAKNQESTKRINPIWMGGVQLSMFDSRPAACEAAEECGRANSPCDPGESVPHREAHDDDRTQL